MNLDSFPVFNSNTLYGLNRLPAALKSFFIPIFTRYLILIITENKENLLVNVKINFLSFQAVGGKFVYTPDYNMIIHS